MALQVDRAIKRVALESVIAGAMLQEVESGSQKAAKSQEAAKARLNAQMAACDKQIGKLVDISLKDQVILIRARLCRPPLNSR